MSMGDSGFSLELGWQGSSNVRLDLSGAVRMNRAVGNRVGKTEILKDMASSPLSARVSSVKEKLTYETLGVPVWA